MKTSFQSNFNFLFVMICFIFFGFMVRKKLIVETFYFVWHIVKFQLKSIKITNFLIFCWNFTMQLRKSKSLPLRFQKILWKHLSKVLSILYLQWFVSYFLDAWFGKNSLWKFFSSVWNMVKFQFKSIKIIKILIFCWNSIPQLRKSR